MTAPTNLQIINDDAGNPAFAVIPYTEYLHLVDAEYDDNLTIPHAVVSANLDGDSPIKAWREHLLLTQAELAARMNVSQPSLAKLERPAANPRKSTLRKVAEAMEIELGQLDI